MRIVIVGAGVAGCIMARSAVATARRRGDLPRAGRADDHSEAGTGLNIGPNAVEGAARRTIRSSPVASPRASFPWRNWRISLTDGTVLFDLPLTKVADNDGLAHPLVGALSRAARSGGAGDRLRLRDHAMSARDAADPAQDRASHGPRTATQGGSTTSIC